MEGSIIHMRMRVKRKAQAFSKEIWFWGSFFTKFDTHSQGAYLYHFLGRKLNIPLHAGVLIHTGKVVNSVGTLNSQGFSMVFHDTSKGWRKDYWR